MLLEASGSTGIALLLVGAVALPMQCALGALIALRRRVPAALACAAPALLLLLGALGTVLACDAAVDAVRAAEDPSWGPFFAIEDRSRAAGPQALGSLLALGGLLPVAIGAAIAGRRAPELASAAEPRWSLVVTGLAIAGALASGALAALGTVAAQDRDAVLATLPAAIGLPLLTLAGAIAASRRSSGAALPMGARGPSGSANQLDGGPAPLLQRLPPDPRAAARIAAGVIGLAAVAAPLTVAALADLAVLSAIQGFEDPWSLAERVAPLLRTRTILQAFAALAGAAAVVASLPSIALRDWRQAEGRDALDVLSLGLAVVATLGLAAWGGARRDSVARFAGDHASAVLLAAPPQDLARVTPLPPRVLLADPAQPRWIAQRDRGGLDVRPIPDGLEAAGAGILLGDGLLLPPAMSMLDAYLLLADAPAGRVSLVGCAPPSPSVRDAVATDPLLAVGRCGAFPLSLRVTEPPVAPRSFIVLRDGLVDDGGEVVPRDALGDLAGHDVLLRAQGDATVADVLAVLPRMIHARQVWLAWGVDVDGADIAVGVAPDRWGAGG